MAVIESGTAITTDPSHNNKRTVARDAIVIFTLAILSLYGISNYAKYTDITVSNSGLLNDTEFNPDFIEFQEMTQVQVEGSESSDDVTSGSIRNSAHTDTSVDLVEDPGDYRKSAGKKASKASTSTEETKTPNKAATKTFNYPTFLVILKSPRSGSTFLNKILNANPNIQNKFEPLIPTAKMHFETCKKKGMAMAQGKDNYKPWACSVSFNDYLKGGRRFREISQLIRDYDATIVIQLRANVVEKSISANKLWGELKKSKTKTITPTIAKSIKNMSLKGFKTIRGFVNAEKFMPKSNNGNGDDDDDGKPIWLWYEDLVRDCNTSIKAVHDALGIKVHEKSKQLCDTTKFRRGSYNNALVSELEKEPKLVPMIDAFEYNNNVDTDAIHEEYKIETQDVQEVELGFWR